nr:reverse transcriptase domain-containing protein [Tanacetum cinerariifolium]
MREKKNASWVFWTLAHGVWGKGFIIDLVSACIQYTFLWTMGKWARKTGVEHCWRWLCIKLTEAVEMAMIAMILEVAEGHSALLVSAPTTVGLDAAYGMSWKALKKMMTGKYCPRSEIKKLETEIQNLKVKGTDVVSYTQCFQELELMCRRMFTEESDEVEKYVSGLPDMIQGSVMASKQKTMQDAIEFANELMDQKTQTFAER